MAANTQERIEKLFAKLPIFPIIINPNNTYKQKDIKTLIIPKLFTKYCGKYWEVFTFKLKDGKFISIIANGLPTDKTPENLNIWATKFCKLIAKQSQELNKIYATTVFMISSTLLQKIEKKLIAPIEKKHYEIYGSCIIVENLHL